MAQIRLGRLEAEEGELPAVCLRCGAPAMVYLRRRFAWYPRWLYGLLVFGVVPFFPAMLLAVSKVHMRVPLCDLHRHHWRKREMVAVAGLILLVLIGAAAWLFLGELGPSGPGLSGLVCFAWVMLLLVWVGGAVWMQRRKIRPTLITAQSITLTGVAEEFVKHYQAVRTRK